MGFGATLIALAYQIGLNTYRIFRAALCLGHFVVGSFSKSSDISKADKFRVWLKGDFFAKRCLATLISLLLPIPYSVMLLINSAYADALILVGVMGLILSRVRVSADQPWPDPFSVLG